MPRSGSQVTHVHQTKDIQKQKIYKDIPKDIQEQLKDIQKIYKTRSKDIQKDM